MPLTPDKKHLFIHIPKTGGETIEKIIGSYGKVELFWQGCNTDFINGVSYAPQHFTPEILKNRIQNWGLIDKFTIVRNPYTRVLSEYYWTGHQLNFDDVFTLDKFEYWIDNYLKRQDTDHKIPQVNYIPVEDFRVFRFEDCWENELPTYLNEELGISIDKIPVRNNTSGNKEEILKRLPKYIKKKIYQIYEEDFECLGYPKLF